MSFARSKYLPEPPNPPRDAARAAAAILRQGGLVAFPTETVYGLGADALDSAAVSRVFALKGRPSNNPLIVHVTGEAMAKQLAAEWPERATALARAFWPGPLSIIVPRGGQIPNAVTAGGVGVALRCPNHPLALALLFEFDRPLVGPSANRSGRISPTTAEHVRQEFGEDLFILDGGPCTTGIESTVVSLLGPKPQILRPGVIGPADLASALGIEVGMADSEDRHDTAGAAPPDPASYSLAPSGLPSPAAPSSALASPGLLASHYAPRANATLIRRGDPLPAGADVILADEKSIAEFSPAPERTLIPMPSEPSAYARALYSALRQADQPTTRLIAIVDPTPSAATTPEEMSIWLAIADRLARATAPRP